jgi:hypothetical protein
MKYTKTHQALAAINKATSQPWEFSEVYDAMTLHTPRGFYLLTSDSCHCPDIETLDDLMLGWYPDNKNHAPWEIIESVTNLETLTTWATGFSK